MSHTIALAQTAPVAGDVGANVEQHLAFIDLAAENGASLIAFPELSITGYELARANDLAFEPNDPRLTPLRERANARKIIVVVGAPIRISGKLHIGAFILQPDLPELIYTKRYVHSSEAGFFEPGTLDPKLTVGSDTISFAICADITNPLHARDAAASQSTIYLAMALISFKGYPIDSDLLQGYAKEFGMDVFLSNYCVPTGGYISAGRSAAWKADGELGLELGSSGMSLLLATRVDSGWDYKALALQANVASDTLA